MQCSKYISSIMLFLASLSLLLSLVQCWVSNNVGSTVVVISAPESGDQSYYKSVYDEVIAFQAEYARRITNEGSDSVVILADAASRTALKAHGVPDDVIAVANIQDIWIRDFGLVGIDKQVKYLYRPNYMPVRTAKSIQNSLLNFYNTVGITPKKSADLVLDGGNVVDNGVDAAILTNRIYKDYYNLYYYNSEIISILKSSLGYSKIIVVNEIAGDTTGHSDGLVSFIDTNTVAISDLPDNLYNPIEKKVTENGFKAVYLNSFYKEEVWQNFGSACGLHVNLLATDSTLYVPTFGGDPKNAENGRGQSSAKDNEIVGVIAANTNKNVVRIPVPYDVCKMGGSVRCLTMSLAGINARKLIDYAEQD